MTIKLQQGNLKLHKSVATWSLPASPEVCGRVCEGCYSYKAQRRFPKVLQARERNLEAAKEDFDITYSKNTRYCRVHADGEFFSQEYIDKWVKIAKSKPEVTFYAYTKRLKHFDFSGLLSLKNFVLHSSLLRDGSMNYSKDVSGLSKKCSSSFTCPDTLGLDVHCGSPEINGCNWCMIKTNQNTQILFKTH